MKKTIFFILFLFYLKNVIGQELVKTTVFEKTFDVALLNKTLMTQPFLAGDTIVITINETEGRSLAKFTIKDVNSSFERIATNVTTVTERMVVAADTELQFIFDNDFSVKKPLQLKRNISIKIEKEQFIKKEEVAVNDFIETETITIYDTSIEVISADTAFARVLDEKVYLASEIEPNGKSRKAFQITPVVGATYYVYWVGVGKQPIQDYARLQSVLPPDVIALGALEPIDAFALGKIKKIPSGIAGEDVFFSLMTQANQERFLRKQTHKPLFKEKTTVAHGIIDAAYISETAPTYVCLSNDNEVSGIEVMVKIAAVTINRTYGEIIKDTLITITKGFRLNTETMSISEAKTAIQTTEKELAAAWERSVKEFEQAQKSLDSAKVARFQQLEAAQIALDSAYADVQRKEMFVNELTTKEIKERLKTLDTTATNPSGLDDRTVIALRMELEKLLSELDKAKMELQAIENKKRVANGEFLQELKKQSLKNETVKDTKNVVEDTKTIVKDTEKVIEEVKNIIEDNF